MSDGAHAPRLLTRAQLRQYLQITVTELAERIDRGEIPRPLWGAKPDDRAARWDVRAVDRALDAASGPTASVAAAEAFLDRALGLQ